MFQSDFLDSPKGNMAEIWIAILFGIVEGVTEWLPVSSTGHMILLEELVGLKQSPEFQEMFLIVVQLGAIGAVVLLFFKQLWPFRLPKDGEGVLVQDIFVLWFKILVACIPAVLLELLFGDYLEELFYNYQTVAIMLIAVGLLFILVENRNSGREARCTDIAGITYQDAFLIGVFQLAAAVLPGTSRSGATIIGGLVLGLSRVAAAEFTFYLAVPVMFGASLVKLADFGFAFTGQEIKVLIAGMAAAFLVSVLVIRFLLRYIKGHDFKVFGWYRIILGMAVIFYFGLGR